MLDVYDFKGKGVAMSMYNTDEVRCPSDCLEARADLKIFVVDHGLCAFVVQDGFSEEDAVGKLCLEDAETSIDFFIHPSVPLN